MAKKELRLSVSEDNFITIADANGGIMIKNETSGAMISVGSDGITIDNGKGAKITLSNNKVDINQGALEVT
jgi:hypothetical protein